MQHTERRVAHVLLLGTTDRSLPKTEAPPDTHTHTLAVVVEHAAMDRVP